MIDRIVIINDLSHAKGGASGLALEAAVQLARRGHAVTMLCGSDGNPDLDVEGVEVIALGQDRLLTSNPFTAAVRGLYNHQAGRMVSQWVERRDTPRTVYHVHGWSQILSPALFSALAPVRERTLVHAHDFFFSCPNGAMFDYGRNAPCALKPMSGSCIAATCDRRGRASKVWRVVRQGLQNHALAHAPHLPQLLIHGGMAPYFARSGLTADDMIVLPNPVTPFVGERIQAERNRDVLFVGRIEATKGIDLAAEACRRAGVRLVAAGSGDLLESLARSYPEMLWVGHQTRAQIALLARDARLAVMPSRHIEPFGLAAIEALWSGLPVLSSADALITRDIVMADAGVSIDPRDADVFAAAITSLFSDDVATRRLSENAFTRTGALALTPELWIDALLAAYGAYLDHGRSGLAAAALRWSASGDPTPALPRGGSRRSTATSPATSPGIC
jgi:glycosyltransferase involved in cell wall biosynthesis